MQRFCQSKTFICVSICWVFLNLGILVAWENSPRDKYEVTSLEKQPDHATELLHHQGSQKSNPEFSLVSQWSWFGALTAETLPRSKAQLWSAPPPRAGRPPAHVNQQALANDEDVLRALCAASTLETPTWPLDPIGQHFTSGKLFIGSSANWRGLHGSGICILGATHPQYVAGQHRWDSLDERVITGLEFRSGYSQLSEQKRALYGFPEPWQHLPAQDLVQVRREFSFAAVVRNALIDEHGAVFSTDAFFTAGGCQNVRRALCGAPLEFPQRSLKLAVQRASAQKGSNFSAIFTPTQSTATQHATNSIQTAINSASGSQEATIIISLNSFWSWGYYHWFFEIIPRLWAIVPLLHKLPSAIVLVQKRVTKIAYVRETLTLLGINPNRLVASGSWTAAKWVIVPPDSGCGFQTPVAELESFAQWTTGTSLLRVAQDAERRPSTRPSIPSLVSMPSGHISSIAAFELLSSFGRVPAAPDLCSTMPQPTTMRLLETPEFGMCERRCKIKKGNDCKCICLQFISISAASSAAPVQWPGQTETLPLEAGSANMSSAEAFVGPAHADALCRAPWLANMPSRSLPGIRLTKQQVENSLHAVDWEATAVVMNLDSACETLRSRGQRLILLQKRESRRWIANHEEVKQWLATRLGGQVTVVEVTSDSMMTQSVLFRCADVVIAPHGAGLSAVVFARPGTRVLEVLPRTGAPPSTYLQASIMRRHVYLPLEADNEDAAMQVSWNSLRRSLQHLGEL